MNLLREIGENLWGFIRYGLPNLPGAIRESIETANLRRRVARLRREGYSTEQIVEMTDPNRKD